MQTTLQRPEPALRHRFDVDDYHRMAEAGILSPDDRVELIGGEIVDMAPIGSALGGTVVGLTELVARAVADGKVLLSVQGPLRLDRSNEPQPDLMLLRSRTDRYRSSHPAAADVLLLVEVADSSLAYDRGAKLALYARHGVAEVWIVDLAGRAVELFREPNTGGFAVRERVDAGAISPRLVPDLAVDLAALFGG
ncbi:MAG: Uma2 family endonuclease [Geminicoccaceae bacterium]